MRIRLNNPKDLNYIYKDANKWAISSVERSVIVDSNYYESVSMAAAKNGISEGTVRKNIREKKIGTIWIHCRTQRKNLFLI